MHAITSFHDQVITHLSKYACNGTYYQTLYDRIIGVPQLNALIFFTTLSQKLYCGISSRHFHYLTRCIQATLFHLLFWYSKEKASSSPKVCSNGNKRRQKNKKRSKQKKKKRIKKNKKKKIRKKKL